MKLITFILTLVGVSYPFEDQCQEAYLAYIHEKCMLANGGDRVVIEDLLQIKPTDNENGKCFRQCIMEECKYYGADGKFNPDVPTRLSWILHGGNYANVKPIEETASKCVAEQTYGDSKCENAEIFSRCMIDNATVKLKFFNV